MRNRCASTLQKCGKLPKVTIVADRRDDQKVSVAWDDEASGALATGLRGLIHDVNNFLAVALGNMEWLKDEERSYADVCEIAEEIRESGVVLQKRMAELREVASRAQVSPVPTDLAEWLLGQADLLRLQVDEGLELVFKTPQRARTVSADPVRLNWILAELLQNAGRNTPKPGQIIIAVALEEDGGATLSVSNPHGHLPDGVGRRVLWPYVTDARDYGHIGLGLSRAGGLARQMGAMLSLASDDDGVTVALRFPG